MRSIPRYALGLVFLVFGLNGFLGFLPAPPPTGEAAVFITGLMAAGYLFPLLKLVEITAGVMLLAGRGVPLALTLLAPIIINIVGFHATLAPEGMPIAIAVLAGELYLAWTHRRAFAPLFAGLTRRQEDGAAVGDRRIPA